MLGIALNVNRSFAIDFNRLFSCLFVSGKFTDVYLGHCGVFKFGKTRDRFERTFFYNYTK